MHFKALREAVEEKFGSQIKYTKDCMLLSEMVHSKTGRQLSVSTLKRFWQLIQSPFNPSEYTLDSLAIFVEFKNWEHFVANYKAQRAPSIWMQAKEIAKSISNEQLHSISGNLLTSLDQLVNRNFLFLKYQNLKSTDQTATALVGDSGIGKTSASIMLVQSINNDDANNDIGIFLDAHMIVNHTDLPNRVGVWLAKKFKQIDASEDIWQLLNTKRSQDDGKLLIVFDKLDVIKYIPEFGHSILANILDFIWYVSKFNWIKVIVNCRPETWKDIGYHIQQHINHQTIWMEVQLNIREKIRPTLPELTEQEILLIARKHEIKLNLKYINQFDPELTDLLKHPIFLHVYITLCKMNTEPNFIDIMQQYFGSYVFGGILRHEKRRILTELIEKTNQARVNNYTEVKNLNTKASYPAAYLELIQTGVLVETEDVTKYLSINSYVQFSQQVYLEFYLMSEYLQRFALSENLLYRIQTIYVENSYLLNRMYLWLMRFSIADGNNHFTNLLLEHTKDLPNFQQIRNLTKSPTLF